MYFTICIPSYNRAHTIIRTLESLERQSFSNFEVIIIDDGSTDDTGLVVNQFIRKTKIKIDYYKKKNGGKHTALNLGISKARGKYFCILDSDDWLKDDTLNRVYKKSRVIENDNEFCGIMGKSMLEDGTILGKKFPEDPYISSYVDFHFINGPKLGPFGDCCEFIKTSIIKNYSYPENDDMKFVPEAYVFDQIGTKYKLLCTNSVYKVVEYQDEGITQNKNFKNENIIGYMYNYISRLENVIPNVEKFPLKFKVATWWRYWDVVKKDPDNKAPRVGKIDFWGYITFFIMPILDWLFKNLYRDIYDKGR